MKFAYRPREAPEAPTYQAPVYEPPAPLTPSAETGILDLRNIKDEAPEPLRELSLMHAAPPSRSGVPGGGSHDGERTKVDLSRAECEIARLSGIDYETYARGKLKLRGQLARGERQNG